MVNENKVKKSVYGVEFQVQCKVGTLARGAIVMSLRMLFTSNCKIRQSNIFRHTSLLVARWSKDNC